MIVVASGTGAVIYQIRLSRTRKNSPYSRLKSRINDYFKTPTAAPPARASSTAPFIIHLAPYGAEDKYIDVSGQLMSQIQDGRLNVLVGNQIAGDPCPGAPKTLTVEYSDGSDQRKRKTVTEGDYLRLP